MLPTGDEKEWPRKATIKALERGWKFLGDAASTVVDQLNTCKNDEEAFLLGMWAMNKALELKAKEQQ
jgi:hypothetical protein